MKTLANCKPSEFIRQSNLIRHSVAKWMTANDVINIRKKMAFIPPDATEKERQELLLEQGRKNLSEILDNALDVHPEETMEVIALCCFVDPSEFDNNSVSDYLNAVAELLSDKGVINFFISLVRLGLMNISDSATK